MQSAKRVFILGAGFSKAAGMPLATELLPLLAEKLEHQEMEEWLESLRGRLGWLSGNSEGRAFHLNIEQVFHYARFDIETHRLRQHLVRVGRKDGPDTPWNVSERIGCWLGHLEDALRDVILERDDAADLEPIILWAKTVDAGDTVVTFNYDALAERALSHLGIGWNHGTPQDHMSGIAVCKLHGSIDWIVADRSQTYPKLDLIFEKENVNRSNRATGDVEDDSRLWRCRNHEQLKTWISGRDFQSGSWKSVGIAGLGAYKEPHRIPGLGQVWVRGMRALYEADFAVAIGFSMSDFDALAQLQFAHVARDRENEVRPLRVIVVDPFIDGAGEDRFCKVFRHVQFVKEPHEKVDWNELLANAAANMQIGDGRRATI
jgi:hypothetical protein